MSQTDTLSWKASDADRVRMGEAADRAAALLEKETGNKQPADVRRSFLMDLNACHSNGNPLDFAKLLEADDFNFGHDVFGIARHINRETGKLGNCFSPRCSA